MNSSLIPIAGVTFAILLSLTGCVAATPTPGMGAFATDAFSIGVPNGWSAAPCTGSSVAAAHARELGSQALACLSTSEAKGTSCAVSFRAGRDPAAIEAAAEEVYRDGAAAHYWRIDAREPVTIDGRPSRAVIFSKPHGEPFYAVRDVWVPAEDGVYIVTCLTYANSYRKVDGQQVALKDYFAPAFDGIIGSLHLRASAASTPAAAPTPTAQERAAGGATAAPTARPAARGTTPAPGESAAGKPDPACSFSATGSGPAAGWTWLRDRDYRDQAVWECTGLPAGSPLPITLTTLVTNAADGGSGYSTAVRVTARRPPDGPEWTGQVYLQNPIALQNPENSRGAGYHTTAYFVLPANTLGAGGALQLRLQRLAPEPYHVAVNAESLHFDAPRPAAAFTAEGSVAAGWTWLRDRAHADTAEWRISGLQPGLPTILALDLLVTDGPNGGAGFSAPVALTISGTVADAAPQALVVQAQNLLFAAEPGDSGGRGYQAYGSLAVDPRLVDSRGELVVRLARPPQTERHVAVNRNSVAVVQIGTTAASGAGGAAATATPARRTTATATPARSDERAACEAQGGRWGRIGTNPREQCNLPAADAGKACQSSSECEGVCLAELTQAELTAVMREKKVIRAAGKCSAWRIVAGCIPMVDKGLVRPICID